MKGHSERRSAPFLAECRFANARLCSHRLLPLPLQVLLLDHFNAYLLALPCPALGERESQKAAHFGWARFVLLFLETSPSSSAFISDRRDESVSIVAIVPFKTEFGLANCSGSRELLSNRSFIFVSVSLPNEGELVRMRLAIVFPLSLPTRGYLNLPFHRSCRSRLPRASRNSLDLQR